MKILITGFESRPDNSNASHMLLSSLMQQLPAEISHLQSQIKLHIMPDDAKALATCLDNVLQDWPATHCLFIGQAPSRNNITLEQLATNYLFTAPPVNIGEPPQGHIIDETGPGGFVASLNDLPGIAKTLQDVGIPAAVSYDAGNSLCNQLLYLGMRYAEQHAPNMQCGFIHIPALPEQVIARWPKFAFMPMDMTRQAIAHIVLHIAETSTQ